MDDELMSWKNEMEKMLAAIDRQTTHSLCVIKSIFKRCGRTLPPDFKQHFLQVSSNRIKTTYDKFEIDSSLEESMDAIWHSAGNVAGGSSYNGQSRPKSEVNNGQTRSFSNNGLKDDFVAETLETEPIDDASANSDSSSVNSIEIESDANATQNIPHAGPISTGLLKIDDPIVHLSNTNDSGLVDFEVSSDLNFDVELDESNDSIEMVENQNDSTDADDDEVLSLNVISNRLKVTNAELAEEKLKATQLKRKSHEKRMMEVGETNENHHSLTSKGKRSSSKKLVSRTQKKCTVCGYVTFQTGHLNIHMRTHTGEKPYGCDRCGKGFARATSLMIHAATHIADFPFHCHACFHGFPSKTEMVAHENRCKKRHFECHLCKKFITFDKADLMKHMRTHTGYKPFRCEICIKRFVQKHQLKRHLNKIHA